MWLRRTAKRDGLARRNRRAGKSCPPPAVSAHIASTRTIPNRSHQRHTPKLGIHWRMRKRAGQPGAPGCDNKAARLSSLLVKRQWFNLKTGVILREPKRLEESRVIHSRSRHSTGSFDSLRLAQDDPREGLSGHALRLPQDDPDLKNSTEPPPVKTRGNSSVSGASRRACRRSSRAPSRAMEEIGAARTVRFAEPALKKAGARFACAHASSGVARPVNLLSSGRSISIASQFSGRLHRTPAEDRRMSCRSKPRAGFVSRVFLAGGNASGS